MRRATRDPMMGEAAMGAAVRDLYDGGLVGEASCITNVQELQKVLEDLREGRGQ